MLRACPRYLSTVCGYKRGVDRGAGQQYAVVLEGTATLAGEPGGGDRTHWSGHVVQ